MIIEELIEEKYIVVCPKCGAYNAYAWEDSTIDPNTHERWEDCMDDPYDIYHIPACSSFEWTCGKCDTPWMDVDSVLNSECYTHVPGEYWDEVEEW